MKKVSTTELVNTYFDLHLDISLGEDREDQLKHLENQMLAKTSNINYIILRKKGIDNIIDTRIKVLRNEIKRLQDRQNANKNAWNRLKQLIMILVDTIGIPNVSGNKQIKTDLESYTVVNKSGKLEVTNYDKIPDEFLAYELKYKLGEIRKHVIKEGGETEYAKCEKKKELVIR